MRTRDTLGTALTALAVLCAVVTTAVLVRREFFSPTQQSDSREPLPLENSEKYRVGRELGTSGSPISIVVFSDFQCPFCKRFADSTWRTIRERYPNRVSLIFRHWPLSMHPHAYAAARASECAAAQGRFPAFHDALFAKQDSIGRRRFEEYAEDAGVPDVEAFRVCSNDTTSQSSIERDIAAVREIGGRGTPTVLVGDLRFPVNPTTEEILRAIDRALERKR